MALVCSAESAAHLAAQLGPPDNPRVEGLLPEVAFLSETATVLLRRPAVPPGAHNVTRQSHRFTVSKVGTAIPIWDSGDVASGHPC